MAFSSSLTGETVVLVLVSAVRDNVTAVEDVDVDSTVSIVDKIISSPTLVSCLKGKAVKESKAKHNKPIQTIVKLFIL